MILNCVAKGTYYSANTLSHPHNYPTYKNYPLLMSSVNLFTEI